MGLTSNPQSIFLPGPSGRGSATRSLERGLLLARLLAANTRAGWRLSDLARSASLEHSTTHRLLQGLLRSGLALQIPGTRRYTLGPLAFELGLATAPHHDLDRLVGPVLRDASMSLGVTIYLMARSGEESVCLTRHDPGVPSPSLLLDPGGRRPLIQTAGGLAILMALPAPEQRRIELSNRRVLTARDQRFPPGIERMLKRSRTLAFAVNLGDVVKGINATALAVSRHGGEVLGSITFAQAESEWDEARVSLMQQALGRLASEISPCWSGLRY